MKKNFACFHGFTEKVTLQQSLEKFLSSPVEEVEEGILRQCTQKEVMKESEAFRDQWGV